MCNCFIQYPVNLHQIILKAEPIKVPGTREIYGGKQTVTGAHYGGKTPLHTTRETPRNMQRLPTFLIGRISYGMG